MVEVLVASSVDTSLLKDLVSSSILTPFDCTAPINKQRAVTRRKSRAIRLKLRELGNSIPAPEYIGRNTESDLAAIQNLANIVLT